MYRASYLTVAVLWFVFAGECLSADVSPTPTAKKEILRLMAATGHRNFGANVANDAWAFEREETHKSGKWTVWKISADFNYHNGKSFRETHFWATQGDKVEAAGNLAFDSIVDAVTNDPRATKTTKKKTDSAKPAIKNPGAHSEEAIKATELSVCRKLFQDVKFRQENMDKTLREIVQDELDHTAAAKKSL